MNNRTHPIFIGETAQIPQKREIKGEFIDMLGDVFFRIKNYDAMEFFMSRQQFQPLAFHCFDRRAFSRAGQR
jgi:hypothetical protein